MIEWMIQEHGLDRKRVYITGLSAGAAMTSVLLATYPEVFAGGAIIAGLPFGIATNLVDAIALMKGKLERSCAELGDLVRTASPNRGSWPKLSIWHGGADTIVAASNADAITRQWCNVHGLRHDEALQSQVCGQIRRFWRGLIWEGGARDFYHSGDGPCRTGFWKVRAGLRLSPRGRGTLRAPAGIEV